MFYPPTDTMAVRRRRTVFPPGPPAPPVMVHANVSPETGVEFVPEVAGLNEEMKITMLGAGLEVGRSCCVIEYRSVTVVCDTGVHPAYTGMAALPYLDEVLNIFLFFLLKDERGFFTFLFLHTKNKPCFSF